MAVITNNILHPDQLPRMATALGVNLENAALAIKLDTLQRHNIAFRCSVCREKSACDAWLAAHGDGAAAAPEYCRNKSLLEELRS
jgi:hypothetical protein